jgi:hypothetical protein
VDAAGKICAASIFDIGAAASLAAALTVLLPAQARASVDAKKLDQGLFENLREICNVTVTAFVTGGASQLSLSQLYDKPAELPPEAAAIVKKPSARLDTTIAVRGYPGGYLALLCA